MPKKNKETFYTISNEEFFREFEKLKDIVTENQDCVIRKINELKVLQANHLAHHEEKEKQESRNYIKIGLVLSVVTVIINILFKVL